MSYRLPTRKLVSQADHAMIERPDVPRTKFSGSWTRKTTFDAGYLVPFLVDEVLPGDHLKYDVTAYVRMSTPLFPLFDNQRIDTFFFFVPNRIVWDNWVKFMGEQEAPGDSISFTVPVVTSAGNGFPVGSVYDHMGLPTIGQPSAPITVNVLPLRAYKLIYHEWFRDQNLITNAIQTAKPPKDNGPDSNALYVLWRRAKSHDYFTSALPWPQKFTAPTVPLGGTAPVYGIGIPDAQFIPLANSGAGRQTDGNGTTGSFTPFANWANYYAPADIWFNANTGVYADLSTATGVTINTLRQAFLVQQLLERDARGGTRYVEVIKSHFGVTSPDFRLQRPEYIGGGSTPLQITPIAQTATGGGGLGAIGAAGTAAGNHTASYAATEHGYIIGIINVKSELSYSQGTHKMWDRSTRYDFYWPSLAGLGEQAVLRREIYTTGDANDQLVFGYQERWHEYRTRYSEVTGLFRPTSAGNLDEWHLSQQFTAAPTLGQSFIEDTPPMSRVLAAGETAANAQYLADILIRREAVRPLPMFGTPVTLGRF